MGVGMDLRLWWKAGKMGYFGVCIFLWLFVSTAANSCHPHDDQIIRSGSWTYKKNGKYIGWVTLMKIASAKILQMNDRCFLSFHVVIIFIFNTCEKLHLDIKAQCQPW